MEAGRAAKKLPRRRRKRLPFQADMPMGPSDTIHSATMAHTVHQVGSSEVGKINNCSSTNRTSLVVRPEPSGLLKYDAGGFVTEVENYGGVKGETENGLEMQVEPGKYVSLDCEMVGTGPKGCHGALARCSIVASNGDVIYDQYVQPEAPITDYRTPWSGITARHLRHAIPYKAAQKDIAAALRGKIVVGHSLLNDFRAIGFTLPKPQTRDIASCVALRKRAGISSPMPVSLKRLTKLILNRNIQVGNKGHCSVEDARATMELFQLVESTWSEEDRSASHC
uniref:interferon-stimulated gene 20 kDa protein-like n=1 Tax=Myxine glutinosa TaxID=7769 RepID=UPI00358EE94F